MSADYLNRAFKSSKKDDEAQINDVISPYSQISAAAINQYKRMADTRKQAKSQRNVKRVTKYRTANMVNGKIALLKKTKARSNIVKDMNKRTIKNFSMLSKHQQNKVFRQVKRDKKEGIDAVINKKYVKRYGKGKRSTRIIKGSGKATIKVGKAGVAAAALAASDERGQIVKEVIKNKAKKVALTPTNKIKKLGKKGSKAVAKKALKIALRLAIKLLSIAGSILSFAVALIGLPVIAAIAIIVLIFIILGGSVDTVKPPPLYTQYDARWADTAYGDQTIKTSGSMICTVAMLASYIMEDSELTPKEVLQWTKNDYYINGSTKLDILDAAAQKYRLQKTEFDSLDNNYEVIIKRNMDKIKEEADDSDENGLVSGVTVIGITKERGLFGSKSIPILITSYSNDFSDDDFFYRVCSPMDRATSNNSIAVGAEISPEGVSSIPAAYVSIYKRAEAKYNVPWCLLAGVHRIETNFSANVAISSAGAVGHMQFMPRTWVGWSYPGSTIPLSDLKNPIVIARYGGYGTDANGDGYADPWDIEDAIFTAAKYLAASGANNGNYKESLYAYNHADWYVDQVMDYATSYINNTTGSGDSANIYYKQYTKDQINSACSKFYVFVKKDASLNPDATMQWPLDGFYTISSEFGYRVNPITGINELHSGIDIPAPQGTTISAAKAGTIIKSEFNSSMGNYIKIDHGNGLCTVYMHCSRLIGSVGNKVKAGDIIGLVGSTGDSTGPHLHFSVMQSGEFVNPHDYVK